MSAVVHRSPRRRHGSRFMKTVLSSDRDASGADIASITRVGMYGDSFGEGLLGEVANGQGHGGIRPYVQLVKNADGRDVLVEYVGTRTDPEGYRHNCVGGRTWLDVQNNFAAEFAASPSEECWFTCGVNDIIAGSTAPVAAASALAALQAARVAAPSATFRLFGEPDTNSGLTATIRDYNLRLEEVADQVSGECHFVAAGHAMWNFSNTLISGLSDGIGTHQHLIDQGYSLVAGSVWKDINLSGAAADFAACAPTGGALEGLWLPEDYNPLTGISLDSSGNGRNLTQGTPSQRPSLGTTPFGPPAWSFSAAAAQFLRTASYGPIANSSMVALVGPNTVANGCVYDSANAAARNVLFGSGGGLASHFAGATVNTRVNLVQATRWHLMIGQFNFGGGGSTTCRIYSQGQFREALAAGAQGQQGVTVGATASGTQHWNGLIGFVAHYSGNLDIYKLIQVVKRDWPGVVPVFVH